MRANENNCNLLSCIVNINYETIPVLHDIEKETFAT